MRKKLLLILVFLFILCDHIRAQQTDCNTTHTKEIDLEIKILQAQLKAIKIISSIDSTAKYRIIYKEYRSSIQHNPHGPWMSDDCLQKYNDGDTLSYAQAVSLFMKLSQTKLLIYPPVNHGNKYLTMSYRWFYIGDQTSWRGTVNAYFKRLEP